MCVTEKKGWQGRKEGRKEGIEEAAECWKQSLIDIAPERSDGGWGWVGMAMASQEWEVEATWNVAQSHHLLSNHVSVRQDALLSESPERICLLPGPEKQPCEVTGSTIWPTFRNNRSMLC